MVSTSTGAALAYDPLGRLFQVTASGGAVTRFLYDGDALVSEYDGSNAMLRRHVHWPGADRPMTTYEGAGLGTLRQLFTDHQGSIVATADANGAIVAVNRYDEYGIPGAGNTGRFQYTGQAWLDELGMYHYKARIYSPTLGRFMQTDPVGYQDQFNLYAYVGNDPVNRVDPTGECDTVDGQRVGICGGTGEEQDYVDARIADDNSEIRQVEALAIEKTQRIDFRFGTEAPDFNAGGRATDVEGGRTNVTEYANGTRDIQVTIDRNDDVTVRGENRMGRTADRTLNTEEKTEHELGSHARSALEGRRVTGPAAVDPDNRYRSRAGINFRRTGHDTDTVRVRQRRDSR